MSEREYCPECGRRLKSVRRVRCYGCKSRLPIGLTLTGPAIARRYQRYTFVIPEAEKAVLSFRSLISFVESMRG